MLIKKIAEMFGFFKKYYFSAPK